MTDEAIRMDEQALEVLQLAVRETYAKTRYDGKTVLIIRPMLPLSPPSRAGTRLWKNRRTDPGLAGARRAHTPSEASCRYNTKSFRKMLLHHIKSFLFM
jgi:hypothetical protein